VIVIIGENRTFDHIFAIYVPKGGNTVNNLLSEGIIKADGAPGPNYSKTVQYSADVTGSTTFQLAPTSGKTPYSVLPAPLNGARPTSAQTTASATSTMPTRPNTDCRRIRSTTISTC
jgi:phospholipase C